MTFMYVLVCTVCVASTHVLSQLQGFQPVARIQYPMMPTFPMPGNVWIPQNQFMGFPNPMGMVMPRPMWTGFQQWAQPTTTWQTSWNNNNLNNNMNNNLNNNLNNLNTNLNNNLNNLNTNLNTNLNNNLNANNGGTFATTSVQTADPWSAYRQFSTGMNSIVSGTQTTSGSNPVISSRNTINGVSSKNYPWNTFATMNTRNVPIIPNNANTGRFPGAANTMNTVNGGFLNNQISASGLGLPRLIGSTTNTGIGNLGNSQLASSSFLQNGGLTGNTNTGLFSNTQGLNTNQWS